MHSAHLFSLMACVCVQRMHIGVGCVCLCIQSHSSCCSPPVAERSLGSVVAPNSPSGLTGSQAQAEPSQPGWTCTELHLSCTAEVIHSNLTGAVRTAFIFPRLSQFFSSLAGWLTDVHQLQCLPLLQHSSRPHSTARTPCSMKHYAANAHPVFLAVETLMVFKKALSFSHYCSCRCNE